MKIGFIGAGNMASAILRGAVRSGAFAADDLCAFDLNSAKTAALQNELGISAAKDEKKRKALDGPGEKLYYVKCEFPSAAFGRI